MKRNILLCGLLLLFFFPVLKVDATTVVANIESNKPVKSKKYDCNGGSYIMYLPVPNEFVVDKEYSENTVYHGEDENYGFEMSVYFFKNKKTYQFDSKVEYSYYLMENNKTYCLLFIDKKYAGNQGLAYKYRYYIIDENGNKKYSQYSKETVMIPYVTGSTYMIASKGKTIVYWTKMKGAKSYTVYTCTTNGKNKKKVITTKKNSATINTSKFKKNKCYYFYVKANGVKYKKKKYNTGKFDIIDYSQLLSVVY